MPRIQNRRSRGGEKTSGEKERRDAITKMNILEWILRSFDS
ncbi:hypothetical protein BofuT4_uP043440.1 [Botrytis cinerea T4]|uniref:Uncharacterized protein n=1 Tax=Botryotinia fuckeliana (strain T4) TaxID=999810 RepID=G2Y243_BOTF4|nr:hypothetical protein BofuT4_uP043440.1 [Botrytis cinerea T4]